MSIYQGFPCSCRDFTRREINTHAVVSHCPHNSPILELRCHLSLPQGETQFSDTRPPLGAFTPVRKSRIAISTHTILLTPETPKCQTPSYPGSFTMHPCYVGRLRFNWEFRIRDSFLQEFYVSENSDESNPDEPLAPSRNARA
jgi:hypothetical protein